MDTGKLIFLIIFSLSLIGCERPLHHKMNGLWVIEDFYEKDVDYLNTLSINTMTFTKEEIDIPRVYVDSNIKNEHWKNEKAKWEIIGYDHADSIIINSKNKLFHGKYELTFAKDKADNSIFAKLVAGDKVIILHKVEVNIKF